MGRKKIIQKQAEEVTEVMATEIEKISNSMRNLLSGRLNKKAILLLLAASTKIKQSDIEKVLNGAATLDTTFLVKRSVKKVESSYNSN